MNEREKKREKRIDWIERQIEREYGSLCMDDPEDRRKMAEAIYDKLQF